MDFERSWKRHGDDWSRETDRAIVRLENETRQAKDVLAQIKTIVLGDQVHHEDGLETRLHFVERRVDKLDIITVGDPGTHKGGLLEELLRLRADIVDLRFDLKGIREDKSIKVERRRDTLTFWAPIAAGWLALTGSLLLNFDKIARGTAGVIHAMRPNREMELERLRRQIVELRQRHGPEVDRKLKEYEEAAKRYESE